jgi:hypothetical protein
MANGNSNGNGKQLSAEEIRAAEIDRIVASLKGPNNGSGEFTGWCVDRVSETGSVASRLAAGFVAARQNAVIAYTTERERQFRRTAEKLYDKSVAVGNM